MKASGFTLIELLVTMVVLSTIGAVVYDRYQVVEIVHRDHARKVSINTIHANLQEVVKPKLGSYPRVLASSQLTAMNAELLKDPNGIRIGTASSDFRYEPTGCGGGDLCKGYWLSADLEREQDFVRDSGDD